MIAFIINTRSVHDIEYHLESNKGAKIVCALVLSGPKNTLKILFKDHGGLNLTSLHNFSKLEL